MAKIKKSPCFGLTFALMCLPGLAGQRDASPEFGASLKLQYPLGEYKSTVLDASLGYGLGVRTRFNLQPRHALSARLEYDMFPEGGSLTDEPTYMHKEAFQIRVLSVGVNYEWLYADRSNGAYLLIGPVFRRWSDHREFINMETRPGPIPASYSLHTTPSSLGLNVGWGYRGTTDSAIEVHFVSSKYGSTGITANSAQISIVQYF